MSWAKKRRDRTDPRWGWRGSRAIWHSLSATRKKAAHCRDCPLWQNATQTVFGEGSQRALVMLVGEQPGDREDLEGRPFVGPAGKVLDRALADAGIDRRKVYVTNAVKHFKNEPRGKRRIHKKPSEREIEACEQWLVREVDHVVPKLLVALGATAARALTGRATAIERSSMSIDWAALFSFSISPLELIVRGTAMYWFLFLMFRFLMRRETGSVGMADILLLVLVADAAQNAMAGEYRSIVDGMVLVATIAGWDYAIDWASYELPALRPFLEPPAVRLVRNGHILSRSLRREHINEAELMAKLREAGVKELSEVQAAYLESDGQISVLKRSARSRSRLDRSLGRAGAERRRARLRIEVIPQATLHRELWGSLMRGSSRGSAEVLQSLLTRLIVLSLAAAQPTAPSPVCRGIPNYPSLARILERQRPQPRVSDPKMGRTSL